jgi:two-component system cell cycle sensor histidine kinase/response regulator CckA
MRAFGFIIAKPTNVKRVLLIEDNPLEAKLVTGFFQNASVEEFEIEAVSRLRDGIRTIGQSNIDVVLLDLVLEDTTGQETLLRLREAAPEVVVVVLTGLDDEANAIEALKNGAQDYLVKANLNRYGLFRAIRYAVERKRAETERRLLETRLLEGQKLEAIGTLARGVAHNFNNMLTAIIGRSELILEKSDGADNHHVIAIKRSAERAALLTRQLLTFSRKRNHELHPMNLNDVIGDIRLLLESMVMSEITLDIDLVAGPANVKGDRHELGQMLMNLVINARNAMPQGGQCKVETSIDGEHVLLTVRDSGCGMSAETLAHIFEPFFSTKSIALAQGLGLSAVYGIVQQHGGKIEVNSRPGEGTTFSIRFPLL